jgi:hypothetical protein
MEALPKELQNNVKFIDDLNDTLSPDLVENESINIETLSGLGGEIRIGDILVPPPTIGVLLLLESIDSPFVNINNADEVSLDDVLKALYIIVKREEAVTPIMLEKQSEGKATKAFESTTKTPEHLSNYLAYIDRNKQYVDAFDEAVKEFSMEIGGINPEESINQIGDYISICMGGFKMLPPQDSPVKKN